MPIWTAGRSSLHQNLRFLALVLFFLLPRLLHAQEEESGPPISITSPDTGTTYAFASVKEHALIWDRNKNVLVARITFTDGEQNDGRQNEDTQFFRLPGVSFDEAKGVFYAVSPQGDAIPVAKIKRLIFLKVIETTANATVRVLHPRGVITVILEAIRPTDPAMHPGAENPDGTHKVDINKLLQ